MRTGACGLLLLAFLNTATAANLLQVYQDALQNDPQIREAEANRSAAREARPQAWSLWMPKLDSSGAVRRRKQEALDIAFDRDSNTGQPRLVLAPAEIYTTTDGYRLELRQTVFSWEDWMTLRRSSKEVAQAEADYQAAGQDLIQRLSQRYFDVLAAQDEVENQQAAEEAITRQLDQAEMRHKAGLVGVTDVQEAVAARDSATAAVIAAKRQLDRAVESLRAITSQQYESLSKPGPTMPLRAPEPADPERWVERSMDQNVALISSRLAADIARDNVGIARGGHFPRFEIVGSRDDYDSETDLIVGGGNIPGFTAPENDERIELRVTLSLFRGGLTQSQVRQSQHRWIAAKQRASRVSRDTERLARDAYLGVLSEMSRVNALRRAVESSQTGLTATESGYQVGTRSVIEVLTARQTLVQAQTNYSRSRYDYILNVIHLQLAAGTLDRQTLEEINQWLVATGLVRPVRAR